MDKKKLFAFLVAGAVAPIAGNAGAVAQAVISGDPSASFTWGSVVAPAIPAIMTTLPTVLLALFTRSPKK